MSGYQNLSKEEIVKLIQINERQREVAKGRCETDVVKWHQEYIDKLHNFLGKNK